MARNKKNKKVPKNFIPPEPTGHCNYLWGSTRSGRVRNYKPKMAPFKEEHVVMIVPGSETTMAQLGLPEAYTPAQIKIPTRMFPAEEKGKFEPVKIRRKKVATANGSSEGAKTDGDVKMGDADDTNGANAEAKAGDEEEVLYEEDPHSTEGAIYPIRQGKIVHYPAFFALLTHVYNLLSPPFHSPILLVADAAWFHEDVTKVTQFVFEKFKCPAFTIVDSPLAYSYAYGLPTHLVIDVGLESCTIATVEDFWVDPVCKMPAMRHLGGKHLTEELYKQLKDKGWTLDMCEQLKKSPICEMLPLGVSRPAKVATDMLKSITAPEAPVVEQANPTEPENGAGDASLDTTLPEVQDGVLDIAGLMASGKTKEFLAQQEKAKANKAAERAADKAAKKAAAETSAANAKTMRLPNSKRPTNLFTFEERRVVVDEEKPKSQPAEPTSAVEEKPVDDPSKKSQSQQQLDKAARKEERKEERRKIKESASGVVRRELEVGYERLFLAADNDILYRIADMAHFVISRANPAKRADMWDNIIVAGNGSKIRGFKEALLSIFQGKYLISPSSATMFTSELPSNLSTPMGTGANTPQPQVPGAPLGGSSVNRLLLTATHAAAASTPGPNLSNITPNPATPSGAGGPSYPSYLPHMPSQVPTSIKLAKLPEYFREWKESGPEEAIFLGAQMISKVAFFGEGSQNVKSFMTRSDYNELGPAGMLEMGLIF